MTPDDTRVMFDQPAADLPKSPEDRRAVADRLRANPGVWALIGQYTGTPGGARQTTYAIRKGHPGWQMFGPEFEARTATMLGEHRVYARYTG